VFQGFYTNLYGTACSTNVFIGIPVTIASQVRIALAARILAVRALHLSLSSCYLPSAFWAMVSSVPGPGFSTRSCEGEDLSIPTSSSAASCCMSCLAAFSVSASSDSGKSPGFASLVIHVHHLRPQSSIGKRYRVNPIADLRPVCPNCHMVLHLRCCGRPRFRRWQRRGRAGELGF
jgi:hypothetical protein